ncbi:MAG: hypothetical protein ACFCVE_07235 [Phycisphaerae bacterium]
MVELAKYPAVGKVLEVRDGRVVFAPSNTNYEVHLEVSGGEYAGPVNRLVRGVIRATARKVYSVRSGGNFFVPILGTPRIIQGRVRDLSEHELVLQAGTTAFIKLPAEVAAVDLEGGFIEVGMTVNAVLLPGATFEPLE